MPFISIKSAQCQASLGVTTPKSARRKLLRFGAQIIDGEYVSIKQLDELLESKLKKNPTFQSNVDWNTKGTAFEDLD